MRLHAHRRCSKPKCTACAQLCATDAPQLSTADSKLLEASGLTALVVRLLEPPHVPAVRIESLQCLAAVIAHHADYIAMDAAPVCWDTIIALTIAALDGADQAVKLHAVRVRHCAQLPVQTPFQFFEHMGKQLAVSSRLRALPQVVALWTDLVAQRLPALDAELADKTDGQETALTAEASLRIAVLDTICCYGGAFFLALPVCPTMRRRSGHPLVQKHCHFACMTMTLSAAEQPGVHVKAAAIRC